MCVQLELPHLYVSILATDSQFVMLSVLHYVMYREMEQVDGWYSDDDTDDICSGLLKICTLWIA